MPAATHPDRPAVLVFDAYGTLFDPSSVEETCERLFPGHGASITAVWRQKQLEYTWLCSLMERYQDFWQLTAAGLRYACEAEGLTLEEPTMREAMEAYFRLQPYPEVPGALERLSRRARLAILSNGTPEMLLKLTQHHGLAPHFRAILSVHEVGVYKPAPRVYALAAERLGAAPGEVGFVSANGWDAAGAKAFGFRVYWINRASRPPEAHAPPPDAQIGGVDALEAALGG